MLERGRTRVRDVSLVAMVTMAVIPLVKVAIEGELGNELSDPMQWGPLVLLVSSSAIVYAVARSSRVRPGTVLDVALVYEVVFAFGLAMAQHWDAFSRLSADQIEFDVVGASLVAPWMFVFTVLVPVRPGRAAAALAVAGAMPALVYGANVWDGRAPALAPVSAFFVLVFPYLLTALGAWFAARTIYQLGRDLRATQQLGSYRLEERIGAGGMGEVWMATHVLLARPAAVKLISRDSLGSDPAQVVVASERFEREARVTAELKSPHTVHLYDFGVADDGNLFYVMELLDGMDLATLVREHGPVDAARAVHILRQCCGSLAEAHAEGLVHRDIKPGNIFLCRYGIETDFVKILDFGLVKRMAHPDDPQLTNVGVVAGTPSFMPPELALGRDADGRADLYALGCVAYWLVSGHLVFEADTAMAMIVAHAQQPPLPPSQRSEIAIPADLEGLIMRCLDKRPEARPANALELEGLLASLESADAWEAARAEAWWDAHHPSNRRSA